MTGNIVVEVVTLQDPHAVGVAAQDIEKLADSLAGADSAFRRAAQGAAVLDQQIERAQRAIVGLGVAAGRSMSTLAGAMDTAAVDRAATAIVELDRSLVTASSRAPAAATNIQSFGFAAAAAADQTNTARSSIEALTSVMDSALAQSLNQDEARLRADQASLALRQSLAANRGEWDRTTQAGLNNRDALLAQVRAFDDLRRANIRAGMSAEEANRRYDAQIQGLIKLAKAAGAGKDVLNDLAGTYEIRVTVNAIAAAVSKAAAAAAKAMNAVGFAAGGATPVNTPYWVGEQGPELRVDSTPGFVVPHGPSMALANAFAARSTAPTQVELSFSSDGTDLGNLLVHLISKTVRVKGGNAAVLGIRN